jgi:hypothetical protein
MAQTLSTPVETDAVSSAPAPLGRRRAIIFSLVLFFLALVALMVSSVKLGINPFGHSDSNHFVYQAQSLLHGHFDIPHFTKSDIIRVNGKFYILFRPL